MIHVTLSADDLKKLGQERFQQPHPRVQRKMEAVYLMGVGLPRDGVARLLHVTEGTVRSYLVAYRDGGLAAPERFNPHSHAAALDAQATTLHEAFSSTPSHTLPEAVDRTSALTGIPRSPPQVRLWIKKTGLAVVKPAPSQPSRFDHATALPGHWAHPPLRRSPGGPTPCLFCRCSAFCLRGRAGLTVVPDTALFPHIPTWIMTAWLMHRNKCEPELSEKRCAPPVDVLWLSPSSLRIVQGAEGRDVPFASSGITGGRIVRERSGLTGIHNCLTGIFLLIQSSSKEKKRSVCNEL